MAAERALADLEKTVTPSQSADTARPARSLPTVVAPAPAAPQPARPSVNRNVADAGSDQPAAVEIGDGGPGVTETEIRFGMSAPFSGSAKELGRQMKLGVETAFNVINDAGGVHGRQVKLVAVDDGYEPTRTAETMKQLYEKDQVFGIIGNVGTPTAAVALPFALRQRMMFFGAFTGANLLRRDPPDRYVFNYRASYAEETDAVVRYLVNVRRLRPEQIVVFAQQDAFGDAGFDGVAKAVRALRSRPRYRSSAAQLQAQHHRRRRGGRPAAQAAHAATGRGDGGHLSRRRQVHREDARYQPAADLHQRLLRRQHRACRGAHAARVPNMRTA